MMMIKRMNGVLLAGAFLVAGLCMASSASAKVFKAKGGLLIM